jgi:hypothetical protein
MIRLRGSRRVQGHGQHRSPADVHAAEVAARLESTCAGWVVIWSPWRRKFTAFGACTPERTIVEDTSVHGLRVRMDTVQLAVAVGAPILISSHAAVQPP